MNCLQYYHAISGLPPDIAHDIFQGFATNFLQKPLSYFIQLKVSKNSECSNKLFQLLSC